MQQSIVPQFIDVEDKVIGPITVRQFIILLVAAGLIFIEYKLADFSLFLLEAVITAFIAICLAFVKINGRPIHYFLLNVLQTSVRPKVRVWQKKFTNMELRNYSKTDVEKVFMERRVRNRVRVSRLAEMALIVDTGGVYQGEDLPGKEQELF
jgi:hypothetical protein